MIVLIGPLFKEVGLVTHHEVRCVIDLDLSRHQLILKSLAFAKRLAMHFGLPDRSWRAVTDVCHSFHYYNAPISVCVLCFEEDAMLARAV